MIRGHAKARQIGTVKPQGLRHGLKDDHLSLWETGWCHFVHTQTLLAFQRGFSGTAAPTAMAMHRFLFS